MSDTELLDHLAKVGVLLHIAGFPAARIRIARHSIQCDAESFADNPQTTGTKGFAMPVTSTP